MMGKFLFWNLSGKPLQAQVAAIVKDNDIDVVLLAESRPHDAAIRRALATEMPEVNFESPMFNLCEKINVHLRYSSRFWKPVAEGPRFMIAEYRPPAKNGLLVAAVHLPSRVNTDVASINTECMLFATKICKIEVSKGIDRTVVVGDLNLDPFDQGVVAAAGLHGVMSRQIALKGKRTVNGEEYRFFYNPMWSRLGDASAGPPGSAYYHRSQQVAYFWHTFDQVLLRPSLLNEFREGSLRFLTSVRGDLLLAKNGTPNRNRFSDHLPLIFDLELETKVALA